MSKSVHHYGYLKQNQGMNTKSQLVVQCYQLVTTQHPYGKLFVNKA